MGAHDTVAGDMGDVFSALRAHIVAIAMCATVVFGYLFRGQYPWALGLLCGLDWCIVNLLNRATDVEEDRLNGIAATEWVARHARALVAGTLSVLALSLLWGFAALPPAMAAVRVLFHLFGLGYSYRIVPTPRGWRRFKDLYALKNGMSAVMFVLSVGMLPVLGLRGPYTLGAAGIAVVLLYFFLFELTFEVLYDLRDAEGDRAVGVPTFPVVHGPAVSAAIIRSLAWGSVGVLALGRVLGAVLTRELLMVAAPLAQLGFLRWRGPEKVSRADCIGITWAGAGLLLFYLAGTALWDWAGLPRNF